MATLPTTSWQTDGEKMETVTDFIFLGSKITVDGDFSCVIKKVHIVKAMFFFFPIVRYGCESWIIKKAEH